KLGQNWRDEDVPDRQRQEFLQRKWILDKAIRGPRETGAVITIFLNYAGTEMSEIHLAFNERLLPELVKNTAVTSIYRGRAQNLAMHYVLRVQADIDALPTLIEQIHKRASDARILISTGTYFVVRKISNLS